MGGPITKGIGALCAPASRQLSQRSATLTEMRDTHLAIVSTFLEDERHAHIVGTAREEVGLQEVVVARLWQ